MTDNHSNHTVGNDGAQHEIINDEQFEDMRDLLEEDFADLLQTFITDSYGRIDILRRAYADNDNHAGFEAAHALKGASINLGANQLAHFSEQLQLACRERTINQQAAIIENVAAALQQVEQEINRRLAP